MTWAIEFSETARRQLEKLDRPVASRIFKFLSRRLAPSENPRTLGEPLKGERFGELWRYRVGDYRLLAKIEDDRLVVLILLIGHRREIYR